MTVVTGELANVVDGGAGATVPATLALTLGGRRRLRRVHARASAKDYDVVHGANVTQHGGRRDAQRGRPGHRLGRAGWSTARSRSLSRCRPRSAGAFAPVGAAPLTLHSYSGPTSNDPLTIRFRQTIGASEPLRTGAYSKTFTFTLSTTTP